jgi:hypothetical protein
MWAISSTSIIRIAEFTRIAAMLGRGRNLKYGRNTSESATTLKEHMMAEIRDVAPLLMFSAVRARAAVAGMPPKMPAKMLAREIAKTSRR